MSFLKELKVKYSKNYYEKKRKEFLDKNTTEIEVTMNTYIDGYHLFEELKNDVCSILGILRLAHELYLKGNPDIQAEMEFKEKYLPMYQYEHHMDIYPDYDLDYFKLCGLAEFYLKYEYENLIRKNFKDKSIDKLFGNLSDSERKKVIFNKKENHLNSFVPYLLENLANNKISKIEKETESYKVNYYFILLNQIYGFDRILKTFDPKNNLKLKLTIDEKEWEKTHHLSFKYLYAHRYMNKTSSPENFRAKYDSYLTFQNEFDIKSICLEEVNTVKDYMESNQKKIISFLDHYYDFENDTDYLKGAIFVKLFFNYNLFRARMNEDEFIKKKQYRPKIKQTLNDIRLYENYSNLLEKTLKTKTEFGSYKWNEFSFNEKQVDTKLTIACINKMNETKNKKDLFCLITNDTDFFPILKEANKLGIDIFLCSAVNPSRISKELREYLDSNNIIFPKVYDFSKLSNAIFKGFSEDDRWHDSEYINDIPQIPKPPLQVLELIESPESRKNLINSLKFKIEKQINTLKSLTPDMEKLAKEFDEASERFIKRDANIIKFKQ
tara:strand:- start:205 stop:1860 length:1656 start_codon:yes stop_codon:yes gene_type:complete